MRVVPFARRDPFWEADGRAAKRARRKRQLVAVIALVVALVAVAGAAVAWLSQVFVLGGTPAIPTISLGLG